MKKVLIFQHDASTSGGVWSVNKTIAKSLSSDGYLVKIFAIRDTFKENEIVDLDTYSLFPKKSWIVANSVEIKKSLKSGNILKAFSQIFSNIGRRLDIKKAKRFVANYDPDFIITSHYQVLDAIPKKYLCKTINVHHQSFDFFKDNIANYESLKKYNGKVKLCWLSKNIMEKAISDGFVNCCYVYNPVKFEIEETADVVNNKKLIAISRIVKEKRIDLMINVVDEIFKDKQFKDWTLDIYGDGSTEDEVRKLAKGKKKINVYGRISDVKDKFLNASINLNTSSFEGFPMNILEASECGVPTISFNYGEAANEQIINEKTGFVVEQDDIDSYKNKLVELMKDSKKLKKFSKNTKEYNKIFSINNNLKAWEKIFGELED